MGEDAESLLRVSSSGRPSSAGSTQSSTAGGAGIIRSCGAGGLIRRSVIAQMAVRLAICSASTRTARPLSSKSCCGRRRGSQFRTRLSAGGRWIRTIGTASESCLDVGKSVHLAEIFASQDATSGCGRSRLRSLRFALRRASAGSARRAGWPYVANSA